MESLRFKLEWAVILKSKVFSRRQNRSHSLVLEWFSSPPL